MLTLEPELEDLFWPTVNVFAKHFTATSKRNRFTAWSDVYLGVHGLKSEKPVNQRQNQQSSNFFYGALFNLEVNALFFNFSKIMILSYRFAFL